ncbi:MAG: hypothetical protein Q7R66_13400 [Undibacterium sp.]|uniref:hypothetical protein n=1 Tax=Undibacterium sp. TaxID=1914977 RepID=UPI002723371C|nr:hypothetical protein [Undibacterium sp.]MDO8653175.1 hypothetical protein [Undibacterium sp.]
MKISIFSQRRKKSVVVKPSAAEVGKTYAPLIANAAAHVRERRLQYTANFAKRGDADQEPENGVLAR